MSLRTFCSSSAGRCFDFSHAGFLFSTILIEKVENNIPVEFVLPVAPLVDEDSVKSLLAVYDDVPVKVLDGRSYDVMASSDLLFVASGTATLEAAVLGAPMVISYKTGTITYLVGKSVLNVDWIGLPNIIMNAERH